MDDAADSPTHPGAILREALCERDMTQTDFAATVGIPARDLRRILDAQAPITSEAALRLAHYFRSSPLLWLEMQMTYDLHRARLMFADLIRRTVPQDDLRFATAGAASPASARGESNEQPHQSCPLSSEAREG